MKRFLHSVENVIFMDGDDTRRAPMAAAMFKRFADRDPLLSVWRPEVLSAGSGEFIIDAAYADKKDHQPMLSLGLSFHP